MTTQLAPDRSSSFDAPTGAGCFDLERVFRDSYGVLVQEADAELQGVARPSSVVSRAFMRAWNERDRFDTPHALDEYLHRAVHDGAVREKYRRAVVHHMQDHSLARPRASAPVGPAEAAPSVDAAWADVAAALRTAAVASPASDARKRRELARHGAATHVAGLVKRRTPWGPWAIAAVAAGGLVLGARALDRTSADVKATKALASPEARVVSSKAGQRAVATLLDGSAVTLGAQSRLIVPPGFDDGLRAVKLEGTASFAVAPDKELPFEVRVGGATLTALGTAFDVAAYPDDAAPAVVRVREGQVRVATPRVARTLGAGEALAIAADGGTSAPSEVVLGEALSWTDGRLVVADRPLREVLSLLQRWYALDLRVKDAALLDRRVTMSAALGVPRDAITALEKAARVKLVWEQETMFLRAAR